MVKCTRSTAASAFKRLRQVRSPGMRFAGDEQHTQPLTHAVGGEHRAVVVRGQLVLHHIDGEIGHRLAAMLDLQGVLDRASDRHRDLAQLLAVDRDGHVHRAGRAIVLDTELDVAALTDDAVAWRALDHDPAVALVALTGQDRVDRAVIA